MNELLRVWLISEIERLEEQKSNASDINLIQFNNGRIHQCQRILHELYKISKK